MHPRRLICTFVVCYLVSIISILAISEISRPWLVSVAEQAGLSLVANPEVRISREVAHIFLLFGVFVYLEFITYFLILTPQDLNVFFQVFNFFKGNYDLIKNN